MSAITEYIHYYQSNYDEWGINRKNTVKSGTIEAAFSQMRNQLNDKMEAKKLMMQAQDIENQYNNLFFPEKETDFSKMLKELTQKTLQQQFGAAAGRINNNLNIEETDLSKKYREKIEKLKNEIKINNLAQDATADQILKRINQIVNYLNDSFTDMQDSAVVRNRIALANNQLEQIRSKAQKELNLGGKVNFSKDIITINKIIQQFNRSFQYYNQRGDLFEWLLPLIKLSGTDLAKENIKEEIEKLIGSNNLGNQYSMIQFSDYLKQLEGDINTSIKDKKIGMNIQKVRSKIDVVIQYATSDGNYKNINVSAKSVTKNEAKIVEDTSLYSILTFSQNENFIKHYLNVISYSAKGGKAPSEQIVNANKLVRTLILQLGAQGFDLNNPAELLIVHNPKTNIKKGKKIRVYNIKALLYIIKNQIVNKGDNRYNKLIQVGKREKGVKSVYFDNNFTIEQNFEQSSENIEDNVNLRLRNLFEVINGVKLTAYIKATQFNQYLKFLDGKIDF